MSNNVVRSSTVSSAASGFASLKAASTVSSAGAATSVPVTARIYLDVDGVLNAVNSSQPRWDWDCAAARVNVNGYPICYSPLLIQLLNEVAQTPGLKIYWLTTWCDEAPRLMAPALGLHGTEWEVVGLEHWQASGYHSVNYPATVTGAGRSDGEQWWKLTAIQEHLKDFTGTALWIDDDLVYDKPAQLWLANANNDGTDSTDSTDSTVLSMAPNTTIGLTARHGQLIREFARQFAGQPAADSGGPADL